ncbi:uncharacterized protein LOC143444880 [Clavelina lepadiformis]|uniref:uncharacterized protein LOC143444880 n=1 Tax=Clavelina lepadiformis TaxID=159417 RepID=UPI00404151DB
MPPTANPHMIVITPGTKLVTVPNSPKVEMDYTNEGTSLPKYAIGLFNSNGSGPRKRKRLTHLTPEEKIMRRKLKNRVAAQTARDRKKMRMESLEETVHKAQQQAKDLLDVNMQLLERAEALERENAELRSRLGLEETKAVSTVSGNRQTVERIKVEFDDAIADSHNHFCQLPDSILSPDESSDESDSRLNQELYSSQCDSEASPLCLTTMECVSPEPAAGSCQTFVDPLQSCPGNVASPTVTERSHNDDDIFGLLEQIGATVNAGNFMGEAADRSTGLDSTNKSSMNGVTQEQLDSIKELINIDHLYSKPSESKDKQSTSISESSTKRPSFKVQLSRSTRLTKLIKQPSSSIVKVDTSEEKPIALFEETAQARTTDLLEKKDSSPTKASSGAKHPMLCNIKQEMDTSAPQPTLLAFDNLDAELDNILFDCESNDSLETSSLVSPICDNMDTSSISNPDHVSDACGSPLSLETPSPMSDLLDPFSNTNTLEYDFFNDSVSVELFPQLAVI